MGQSRRQSRGRPESTADTDAPSEAAPDVAENPPAKKSELLAIVSSKPWTCAACGEQFGQHSYLTMDDAGPLCLDCVDLGHLEFLPSGDAALTRRSKRASRLSAVVIQWSRTRRRYERQGILAEPEAIAQAEVECLADSEVRERRRGREEIRRVADDQQFVVELAGVITTQFPGCPARRAMAIARHAGMRSSGRIGRTSAGRALDPAAVRLAVIAAVRHEDTDYESLLMSGVPREEARARVRSQITAVVDGWAVG